MCGPGFRFRVERLGFRLGGLSTSWSISGVHHMLPAVYENGNPKGTRCSMQSSI